MSITRYAENPFVENMVIPVRAKSIRLSVLGKDDNILVNQSTGEISGTSIVAYKKVDEEEFVKIFTQNIAMTFDLKSAGLKAFNVLMWVVQYNAIGKDEVDLDAIVLDRFIKSHKDRTPPITLSLATFSRGLNELEKSQIIAKTLRKGRYFLNPNFCFNGDRMAFATVIEKNKKVTDK